MKCPYDDKILIKFADNELDEDLARKVREHVQECEACQDALEDIIRTKKMFSSLPQEEDFEGLKAKIEAGLDKEAEIRTELSKMPIPGIKITRALVTALLLIAAIFTGLYYTETGNPVLSSVQGEVYIVHAGRKLGPHETVKGMKLSKGDVIQAGPGSNVDLTLDGKYYMRLKERTEIKVVACAPKRRRGVVQLDLVKGDLLVDVDKGFKGSEFNVDTPGAEVKALGTKFAVTFGGAPGKTWVGVLEGEVNVLAEEAKVLVEEGMKTQVLSGRAPAHPAPLLPEEWRQLSELYMLGKKTRVALLITGSKSRVLELLEPAAIYISDETPRTIPEDLEQALDIITVALDREDWTLHKEGISRLEKIVRSNPGAEYNVQLLLFIAAYYAYIESYQDAITTLEVIPEKYPTSPLISLSEGAKAYIYEVYVGNTTKAREIYTLIIKEFPDSPEANFARERLSKI